MGGTRVAGEKGVSGRYPSCWGERGLDGAKEKVGSMRVEEKRVGCG